MGRFKKHINKVLQYMDEQKLRGTVSVFRILLDIAVCAAVYGSTISDYFLYRFYQKSHFQRKTFITTRDKNRLYSFSCDPASRKLIQNKDLFNSAFAEYLDRDSICLPDCGKQAFCDFVRSHKSVFIKPVALGGGEGIVRIAGNTKDDLGALYDTFCKRGSFVVEEAVVQHPAMEAVHPSSVNTVRLGPLFDGEAVEVLYAFVRFGVGGSFVDNRTAGGILSEVDVESGRICSAACGKRFLNLLRHPDTDIFFPGFQIPHWDKCIALVKEAALKAKGVYYVGWDVAILPDGACLIEANPGGDPGSWQEPTQTGHRAEILAWTERLKACRAQSKLLCRTK